MLSWKPPETFAGETFDKALDGKRLGAQLAAVRSLMLDGAARTLAQIEAATGYPQASISARLRDLRGERGGYLNVQRRRIGPGLFSYRVVLQESGERQ